MLSNYYPINKFFSTSSFYKNVLQSIINEAENSNFDDYFNYSLIQSIYFNYYNNKNLDSSSSLEVKKVMDFNAEFTFIFCSISVVGFKVFIICRLGVGFVLVLGFRLRVFGWGLVFLTSCWFRMFSFCGFVGVFVGFCGFL